MQPILASILAAGGLTICSSRPTLAADQNPQSPKSVEQNPDEPSQPVQPNLQLAPIKMPRQDPMQGEVDYWIDPDRPHIADSSVNVPKGLMLQENGFQQSYVNRRSGIFDFPETLMRLGVTDKTELRFNAPDYFSQSTVARTSDSSSLIQRSIGFQNMQAGFKRRLGPIGAKKFQIAVNPYISIPSGFSNQSTRVDGFIKFPFSQELNEHWDIEGMESFFDPTGVDGHRNFDWQNSLVLNRSWGRQKKCIHRIRRRRFSTRTNEQSHPLWWRLPTDQKAAV